MQEMTTTEKDIARMVTTLRESLGLSKQKFAERYHVSRSRISQWETGVVYISDRNIVKIGELFGIEVVVEKTACRCGVLFYKRNQRQVNCSQECGDKAKNAKRNKDLKFELKVDSTRYGINETDYRIGKIETAEQFEAGARKLGMHYAQRQYSERIAMA